MAHKARKSHKLRLLTAGQTFVTKVLAFALALIVAFATLPAVSVLADLSSANNWARPYISTAIERGIVPPALQQRYTQGITRAEFSALAVALYETVTNRVITERTLFNDTTDLNVQKMGGLGVVTGVGGGNFNPNGNITREQAALIIVRLAGVAGRPLPIPLTASNFVDNVMIESWARDAAGQVQAAGMMTGSNGLFNPKGMEMTTFKI